MIRRLRNCTLYPRRSVELSGPDNTHQSFKGECDVNQIVARYQRTGELPPNPRGLTPQYVDVTPFQHDYTELHNRVVAASDVFRAISEQLAETTRAEVESDDPAPAQPSPPPPRPAE